MPNTWPTFWCEPTGFAVVSLRRFTFGVFHREGEPLLEDKNSMVHEVCPNKPIGDDRYQQGHDASVIVMEREPVVGDESGERFEGSDLWPTVCAGCGAAFNEQVRNSVTQSQVNRDPVYKCAGVFEGTRRDMPPGAMFDATWLHGTNMVGTDGISLQVSLPPNGGDDTWCVDCPSTDGKPWARTGDPRQANVTATPSIASPRFHAMFTDGVLIEC